MSGPITALLVLPGPLLAQNSLAAQEFICRKLGNRFEHEEPSRRVRRHDVEAPPLMGDLMRHYKFEQVAGGAGQGTPARNDLVADRHLAIEGQRLAKRRRRLDDLQIPTRIRGPESFVIGYDLP